MVSTQRNHYVFPEVCFLIFQIIPQVNSKVLSQHRRSSEFVENFSCVQVYHVSLGAHHHEKTGHHRYHKVGFPKVLVQFTHSSIKYHTGVFCSFWYFKEVNKRYYIPSFNLSPGHKFSCLGIHL